MAYVLIKPVQKILYRKYITLRRDWMQDSENFNQQWDINLRNPSLRDEKTGYHKSGPSDLCRLKQLPLELIEEGSLVVG